ncbi:MULTISPECIES: response regulator transcription factor [unclassified Bacillus (in: firmicutes)]|uniref:response regulator transcription factor n=1 Tax=unclassified Bacillus (in: firmicutes) TaxID=185979 RepID=UPI0008E3CA62|nr:MULTISPECIES: response regulator transcription factor [unclassified Bacillus (in: firmicutes)]SFA88746.1 DNA-binding response regulator, OmpR family, contains REC and winged-helix (wHTH) domain [Bacillus sp. UNCCL13]SFQ84685.1 DNA-binding response regulator, OmpR family, contains REC and winged-helix (wHTH) domain [Bacillus sp. cl95]
MYKIMIVEDDPKISSILFDHLSKWGFNPHITQNYERIAEEFTVINPHIVLLDINLPFYDGFYWCQKIRQQSNVPIVFISSRSENMDIVLAMNMGGDDYIQKPFSLEVLMAKVNALLRRQYSYRSTEKDTLVCNSFVLNLDRSTLSFDSGEINLTKNEFQILYILFKKQGQIVSREEIMQALWQDENFIDDNTLTVNIARLRRKITDSGSIDPITTKKRQGYMIS